MTPRRATSNTKALDKALRRLRRDHRLDETGEVLATLAHTSAEMVDLVTSDDPLNDTPPYVRARVVQAHAAVLVQSAGRVAPAATPDAYDDMLRAMEAEIAAEEERAARVQAERQNDEVEAPPWDEVEARMAADPTIWPEAG